MKDKQLPMQLTLPVSLTMMPSFDAFYQDDQNSVVTYLKSLINKTPYQVPISLLCGPQGTGKSHLLFAMCQFCDDHAFQSGYLNMDDMNTADPSIFEGFDSLDILCFDNIQSIAGQLHWEAALFDIINKVIENKTRGRRTQIILTANALPQHIGLSLPDLLSRLQWGTTFTLAKPSDEDKKAILKLHAKQKGLVLSHRACDFLLSHGHRHLPVLLGVLERLDIRSLQTQKKITVAMLKDILNEI